MHPASARSPGRKLSPASLGSADDRQDLEHNCHFRFLLSSSKRAPSTFATACLLFSSGRLSLLGALVESGANSYIHLPDRLRANRLQLICSSLERINRPFEATKLARRSRQGDRRAQIGRVLLRAHLKPNNASLKQANLTDLLSRRRLIDVALLADLFVGPFEYTHTTRLSSSLKSRLSSRKFART